MLKPLSVQLYSLREYAKTDFVQVLKKVAAIGYKAVEPAGFFDLSPAEFKKIIDDLGLEMHSSHRPDSRKRQALQPLRAKLCKCDGSFMNDFNACPQPYCGNQSGV